MFKLDKSLRSWGTPAFNDVLKNEIKGLEPALLPLQQGMSRGNYTSDKKFDVMIININDNLDFIRIKTGVFYTGMITGCSCADDPTPVDEHPEYCELQFDINKTTAEASVTLLPG